MRFDQFIIGFRYYLQITIDRLYFLISRKIDQILGFM